MAGEQQQPLELGEATPRTCLSATGKLFRVEELGEGSRRWRCPLSCTAGGANCSHILGFALSTFLLLLFFFYFGKNPNDPEMSQARPRYAIERPAYSVSLFDEEFEKKTRTYPIGEKLRNLFR